MPDKPTRPTAVLRSQLLLLVVSIAGVVTGGLLGSDRGAQLVVYGSCGIIGSLLGLLLTMILRKRHERHLRIWFPALCAAGIAIFVAFLVIRTSSDAADIGVGFLALLGALLGLPGIFGTLAIALTSQNNDSGIPIEGS